MLNVIQTAEIFAGFGAAYLGDRLCRPKRVCFSTTMQDCIFDEFSNVFHSFNLLDVCADIDIQDSGLWLYSISKIDCCIKNATKC